MELTNSGELNKGIELCEELFALTRDVVVIRFRFLDVAIGRLKPVVKADETSISTDGENIYYNPEFLLKNYMKEPGFCIRIYLHLLFHCIFLHNYGYGRVDRQYWNLACDIAVENIIMELGIAEADLSTDLIAKEKINHIKHTVKSMTADNIYKSLKCQSLSEERLILLESIFSIDSHECWLGKEDEELFITEKQWQELAKKISMDLEIFSKEKTDSESLLKNLSWSTRKKYDYKSILERFVTVGEEITVNADEFDYVYYTYGLNTYGNIPLVEPLEYKEEKRIKDFVIALDTSASCRGDKIKGFLRTTFDILKNRESFFTKINIHIIQCDAQIRQDIKITCQEDLEEFINNGALTGFGATDFRPVFSYVDALREKGELNNLKGLIYFTDGYGIYPDKMPDYEVMFALLRHEPSVEAIPGWAIKVILEEELDEY